jgi:hypothetical protein
MNHIASTITPILEKHLNANLPSIKILSQLICALFKTRSVDLSRLCLCLEGSAKHQSKYRKLQLFFPQSQYLFCPNYNAFAIFMQVGWRAKA